MKRKTQLFGIIWMVLMWLAMHAQAAVVDPVIDFEAVADPARPGTYTFCPVCKDESVTSGKRLCNDDELRMIRLEWKFSEVDYSVVARPVRSFSARKTAEGIKVVLRMTGLKEDEERNCIADRDGVTGCKATYRTAMAPDQWVIFPELAHTFRGLVGGESDPIIAAEYADLFPTPSILSANIAPPYCEPLWGAEIVFPVVFLNDTECDYNVVDTQIKHRILDASRDIWKQLGLSCEDFLRTTDIACTTEAIHPATGSLGYKKRISAVNADFAVTSFKIPAKSSVVVLLAMQMPEYATVFDASRHVVEIMGVGNKIFSSPLADIEDKSQFSKQDRALECPGTVILRNTRMGGVVSTIDPNHKWIENKKAVYYDKDSITFMIQIKNTGSQAEGLVYVEDFLPPVLDGFGAKFKSVTMAGPNRLGGPVTFDRTVLRSAQITPVIGGQVYHMVFQSPPAINNMAAPAFRVLAGDSGIVKLTVPVKTEAPMAWLPDIFVEYDTLYDTLENRGYTLFSLEDVIYTSDPATFVVARLGWQPTGLLYGIMIFVIPGISIVVVIFGRTILSSGARKAAPSAQPNDGGSKKSDNQCPVPAYLATDGKSS